MEEASSAAKHYNLKPHDQRTAVSVRSCAAVQPPEHVGLGSDVLISPGLVVNLLRRQREKRSQENQQLHNRRHFVCNNFRVSFNKSDIHDNNHKDKHRREKFRASELKEQVAVELRCLFSPDRRSEPLVSRSGGRAAPCQTSRSWTTPPSLWTASAWTEDPSP